MSGVLLLPEDDDVSVGLVLSAVLSLPPVELPVPPPFPPEGWLLLLSDGVLPVLSVVFPVLPELPELPFPLPPFEPL